jgi:GTPase
VFFHLFDFLTLGLIEGAHENRGLGHDFLRHIERTKALLFVVDGAGSENRQPHLDLRSLIRELELYNKLLMKKPAFVFANKIDLGFEEDAFIKLEKEAKLHRMKVLRGSAHIALGIADIANQIRATITEEIQPRLGRKKSITLR